MKIPYVFGAFALAAILVACPPPPTTGIVRVQQAAGEVLRSVAVNTQVQFSATLDGQPTTNVSWSVVEGASRGTMDANGNYTAPAVVPSPATATIRATNKSATSQFGEFQLTVVTSGGISGTVTLGAGLLGAPNAQAQTVRLEPQAVRSAKADWNAPRIQGEVLIVSDNSLQSLSSQSASLRSASSKSESGFVRVRVPSGTTDRAFAEKLALETGATVQPNYRYRLQEAPNDTLFNDQANLTQIDVAGAWFTQVNVPDNLIAVLDTGINASHPDLVGRITAGKDFCPTFTTSCQGEDNDPTELTPAQGGGHGTFATGLIGAATNNKAGIAGITQGGKILAVKVFGPEAGGAIADTVALSKGIKYAADQGSKVISMSLGVCITQSNAFDTPDKLTENAITYAVGKGAVLVAASGNNGVNPNGQCGADTAVQFPASNPNVIAVGSVNNGNARSSFSATGAALDLVAPGEALTSLRFDNNAYEQRSGTSFAAPQVSAVAGLIFATNPALTRTEVQSILESTAKDLGASGKDTDFGAGLLQAGAAVSKAKVFSNPNPAPTAKTSVYMYADRLRTVPTANCAIIQASNRNCYDGASALAGRGVVTINGTSGAVAYSITLSRDGNPLQAGTYRVVACVNKNSNAEACDSGDLGTESNLNLQFNGTSLPNINLTLAALP